jgi:hypothetical protein
MLELNVRPGAMKVDFSISRMLGGIAITVTAKVLDELGSKMARGIARSAGLIGGSVISQRIVVPAHLSHLAK